MCHQRRMMSLAAMEHLYCALHAGYCQCQLVLANFEAASSLSVFAAVWHVNSSFTTVLFRSDCKLYSWCTYCCKKMHCLWPHLRRNYLANHSLIQIGTAGRRKERRPTSGHMLSTRAEDKDFILDFISGMAV